MPIVHSNDGTRIAFDVAGAGTALVLIDGAFGSREFGPNGALASILAEHFTVYTYDRRGRGESGDTQPYAVEREVEDVAALIEAAGGAACLYGISSGAALAIRAATELDGISGLALYEASFVVDDSRAPLPPEYLEQLTRLLERDRRGKAVALFMRKGVGLPAPVVAMMRLMPAWSKMKAVAHTLRYDALLTCEEQRGRPLPADRWSPVTQPTIVVCGSKSPEWMRNAMNALAKALPNAEHRSLQGQTHLVKAAALAPVLVDFFASRTSSGAEDQVGALELKAPAAVEGARR